MVKKKHLGDQKGVAKVEASSIVAANGNVDPTLASLFSSSLGPVSKPSRQSSGGSFTKSASKRDGAPLVKESYAQQEEAGSNDDNEDESMPDADAESASDNGLRSSATIATLTGDKSAAANRQRTRKRKHSEDDLEGLYMNKLARQEAKEALTRSPGAALKRQRVTKPGGQLEEEKTDLRVQEVDDGMSPPPQHESISAQLSSDFEKASRTVFLGNVSTTAMTSKSAKKTLLAHLSSHLPNLAVSSGQVGKHKLESIRFRSTAYATALPKRASFAKKELMDATTRSTNAYAVYGTALAARTAAKTLNGSIILERHLRVDSVAHPAKTDHRRCVFVGNLGFVDDESVIEESKDGGEPKKKKKQREPADAEEGLWREFGKAGTVESVRVVRDSKTRVGKGFAYVQFTDENSVEAALLFNDKKFPPLLPRKLRVVRAKSIKRNDAKKAHPEKTLGTRVYRPKLSAEQRSSQGRASKLFGKAGAAQADGHRSRLGSTKSLPSSVKPPEAFIFEGHRAKSGQKPSLKVKKGKAGKPKSRSSKRGAAWKAAGGKKSVK